ncbi:cupin-like domain-containing protein [Streptomyces sp. NPDC088190]|uniref:cupin-like domain-containing protein n=1 Tax=unclassified Streptomyces TaxID=2593676 RepID=UPI002E797539|nr:cupin-like domain-containing protein [Streptomyces sp. JV190]MEE1838765.1 cupin-like domain-containing protein [Streptomyces sp. JV190]
MFDLSPIRDIGQHEFIESHLATNTPLVGRDCFTRTGPLASPWSLEPLVEKFGSCRVPVFDTLFDMQRSVRFGDYASAITCEQSDEPVPYMRWYARQRHFQMIRADEAFAELANNWSAPSWVPTADYVFPAINKNADPVKQSFPAKGFFVCAAGGRTRLHVDPWVSDAVLCQVTGEKRFVMYHPSAAESLMDGEAVVDPEQPDDVRFPRWRSIHPAIDVTLSPGDAIYIPAGWFHAASALTPSVSITWNFIHEVNGDRFAAYLAASGFADPTVKYFHANPAAALHDGTSTS